VIAGLAERTERQYEALLAAIGDAYGAGGREVLGVARAGLGALHREGRAPLVELVDLWAESLQEGRGLFDKPDRLWGPTSAAETLDLIGQTTVGPWQMTDWNIRDHYGPPYGVQAGWPRAELLAWVRARPEVQAKMIADYVQGAYAAWGRRSPHGIQHYFWLEAYLKGEIGQGPWDAPVLVLPDAAGKVTVTPEAMRATGFYAKQILLGHRGNPHGLLYWLWVLGDREGMRAAVATWAAQRRWAWDAAAKAPRETAEPGGYALAPGDVKFCDCHPRFKDDVRGLLSAS